MSTLLALDTATESMSVALVSAAGVRVRDTLGGAQASGRLIPELLALLDEAQLTLADVDAIAYGCGPGAFTGLRTACAVAQGLAFGAGKPVLAIDSLMLIAQDARTQRGVHEVWVAMDARMDEVYAAAYRHDGVRWHNLALPALYTAAALNAAWQAAPPAAVAGSALAAFAARLHTGAALRIEATQSRAAALAVLAQAQWHDGARLAAAQALPLYLRDKVALTTTEREQLRAPEPR